jgi:hypothetical protein
VEIETVFQAHVSPNESIARPSEARTDANRGYAVQPGVECPLFIQCAGLELRRIGC